MKANNLFAGEQSGEHHSSVPERSWEPQPPILGQIDSEVRPYQTFAVRLPTNLIPQYETIGGRYFLLRCSSAVGADREGDWSPLLRRPLFVCGRQAHDQHERWLLYPPQPRFDDSGYPELSTGGGQDAADESFAWLAQRAPGDLLNLLGPFGNGFTLLPELQNLLLLADFEDDPAWFWKLLPLCEQALDRGGRVTFLIRSKREEAVADLLPHLPIQVEVRTTKGEAQWLHQIGSTVEWADQVCAGVSPSSFGELLSIVRNARFRVDRNFAQILVDADLLCGVGACLVCAIPTARGGFTRACVHGPVFDLTELSE